MPKSALRIESKSIKITGIIMASSSIAITAVHTSFLLMHAKPHIDPILYMPYIPALAFMLIGTNSLLESSKMSKFLRKKDEKR